MRPGARILAVVGMVSEAKIIAGAGVEVVIGGGDTAALERRLAAALEHQPIDGLISFGVCGALAPGLAAGDLLLGRRVVGQDQSWAADTDWTQRLAADLPQARLIDITAGDVMVGSVAAKQALQAATGCAAVDMESHVVARTAQRLGAPFVVVRAVSDTAEETLPPAALAGLKPDGQPDILAVLRSLARRPSQLPALLRTAKGAEAAFQALGDVIHSKALDDLDPGVRRDERV